MADILTDEQELQRLEQLEIDHMLDAFTVHHKDILKLFATIRHYKVENERLTNELNDHYEVEALTYSGNKKLEAENASLREALEWYAYSGHYTPLPDSMGWRSESSIDAGHRARQALATEGFAE